jgi:chaperonin GroES
MTASSSVAAKKKKTAGGIVLPGSAAEKANRGEFVAAGTGRSGQR